MLSGEIYNLKDFTKQLSLADTTDALTVVVSAFKQWGVEAFAQLRGAFALSFKDDASGDTYLVRDQLGVEPLYYYKKNPSLHGTSVRGLLEAGVPRQLSKTGLHAYLAYGAVQDPQTLIEDVVSLPPATYLKISPDGTLSQPIAYWKPSFDLKETTLEDAQAEIHTILKAAIMDACEGSEDLPAAFLSGGIDSSAIVALMRQVYPDKPIRTYCVIHEDPRTDEREWARMVAEANHTQHTELLLTGEMIKTYLREALADYDQPSLDGLNVWFVSKLISQAGEKVALSGVGGDEYFMGYGQFAKHRLSYKYARRLKWMPRWCGCLLEAISPNEKVRKLAQLMGYKDAPYYLPRRIFSDKVIHSLLHPSLGQLPAFEQLGGDAPTNDLLNRISWMELRTNVLSMYLRDGYQTSTPHGLNVRAPLLDKRLAEALFQMKSSLKVDATISKPMLVHAAGDGLPMACVTRQKMGFSLPFDLYFKEVLKDDLNDFFYKGHSTLFDAKALTKIKHDYDNGKISWSRIWALYMVDAWCKQNHIEI